MLAGVLERREAGRVHSVEPLSCAHDRPLAVPRLPPALYLLKNICSSVQPCTPEDGHNGARNMLSHWFIHKS